MSTFDWEEQDELQYQVTGRKKRMSAKPPKRYSPRFSKSCRSGHSGAGIHRRGNHPTMMQHAA